MPSSSQACRAPATISSGAKSPPMASTATGSLAASSGVRGPPGWERGTAASGRSLDVERLAALVPATGGAHHVRQLGLAAPGAHAAGGGRQGPSAGPPAAALGLGGLLLGDSHDRDRS